MATQKVVILSAAKDPLPAKDSRCFCLLAFILRRRRRICLSLCICPCALAVLSVLPKGNLLFGLCRPAFLPTLSASFKCGSKSSANSITERAEAFSPLKARGNASASECSSTRYQAKKRRTKCPHNRQPTRIDSPAANPKKARPRDDLRRGGGYAGTTRNPWLPNIARHTRCTSLSFDSQADDVGRL